MMNRTLLRLGQAVLLCALAVLGILDMRLFLHLDGTLTLSQLLLPMAAAAVWLPLYRPGSPLLPTAAITVGLGSLLVTLTVARSHREQSMWGLAESAALLGVLFLVARRARPAPAVVTVAVVLTALGALPLRGGQVTVYVTFGLVQALGGALAIGAGVYLRTLDSARLRAMDAVRAEQRAEFARDLHDFIAHHVTGIVVQAQGARFIAEQDPQRVLLALEQIEQAGAETMASMRRMVGVLRDPAARPDAPLAPIAGVPEIGALVEQFTAAGGPPARLHLDGDPAGLPVEVSTSAYRVAMEALTNIRQHAHGASAADVWIRRTPDWLFVRVADDGPAPRPATSRDRPGFGLAGLGERVAAVGGHLTAGPGAAGGWVVDAALPLRAV